MSHNGPFSVNNSFGVAESWKWDTD